jgi:hypothetical protein
VRERERERGYLVGDDGDERRAPRSDLRCSWACHCEWSGLWERARPGHSWHGNPAAAEEVNVLL